MDFSKHSEGHTSVKVHHQPGGASSFSLAHDDGKGAVDDRFAHTRQAVEKKDPAASGVAGVKKTTDSVMFGEQKETPLAGPGSFTSVKYSGQPPGGKSSFTLG